MNALTQAEAIAVLADALAPFADFAGARRTAPPGLPITVGSGVARRQLTMGDCYRAAAALAVARQAAR